MDGLMDDVESWCRGGLLGGDEFLDVCVWDTSRGPKQLVLFLLKNEGYAIARQKLYNIFAVKTIEFDYNTHTFDLSIVN